MCVQRIGIDLATDNHQKEKLIWNKNMVNVYLEMEMKTAVFHFVCVFVHVLRNNQNIGKKIDYNDIKKRTIHIQTVGNVCSASIE